MFSNIETKDLKRPFKTLYKETLRSLENNVPVHA